MPKIEKKKGPLQSQCFFVFFTYFICPPDDLQKKKKTEIQYLSIYLFTHGTNGKRISHVYKHWKSLDSLSETWVAAEANALDSLWRLANWLDLLDYLMSESKPSRCFTLMFWSKVYVFLHLHARHQHAHLRLCILFRKLFCCIHTWASPGVMTRNSSGSKDANICVHKAPLDITLTKTGLQHVWKGLDV